jgi:hypothetical protein
VNFHTSATSGGIGFRIVSEYDAENRRTDAGTLRHCDTELRAWAAVLGAHGGNAGGAPCSEGEVTPELSERGSAVKQPCGARTRVDHVAHITGVVLPVPLEFVMVTRALGLPSWTRFTREPSAA